MPLPPFTVQGDLPPGLHRATLRAVLERFGSASPQRMLLGLRLERVYNVAWATGYLERVAELMLNKFNGLHGTKIELVKHRNKENTRRTRTECYPGVLSF